MKKMAIFVEGQTEQVFTEKLLHHIADEKNIHVDSVKGHGGGKALDRRFVEVNALSRPDPAKDYYVIIYDSSNDSRVVSDIRDSYQGLVGQGFREIIGVRDVYPIDPTRIPDIRASFAAQVPTDPVPCTLVLSVMEIEAWFIAEYTHFPKMHWSLTHEAICTVLGYDPAVHDCQTIPHPAADVRKAYDLAKLGYNKSKRHVERTVRELDYAHIYIGLRNRIPDLGTLAATIDRFMS